MADRIGMEWLRDDGLVRFFELEGWALLKWWRERELLTLMIGKLDEKNGYEERRKIMLGFSKKAEVM
jgi:hypothetical protein